MTILIYRKCEIYKKCKKYNKNVIFFFFVFCFIELENDKKYVNHLPKYRSTTALCLWLFVLDSANGQYYILLRIK